MAELTTLMKIQAARAWRPNTGDMISGAIVAITSRTSEYGTYPVVTLDTGDDTHYTAVHAFHTTLLDGLKQLRPTPGETLTIAYMGKVASNKRKDANGDRVQYHHYVIDNPDSTTPYSWDDPDAPQF